MHEARDHITHYHAEGEDRYLCGVLYDRENDDMRVYRRHRTARTFKDVMCNKCQRVHNRLLADPKQRHRLAIDSKPRPIVHA